MQITQLTTRFSARTAALPVAAVRAVPVAGVLVAALAIAWQDRGSIAAVDFLPSSVAIALIGATVCLSGVARRPPRGALAALGLLAALALWAGLSGYWAPVPSLARDEALLVLTGALALGVPLAALRTAEDRLAALVVFAAGLTALAIAAVVTLHGSSNAFDVFRYRRLSFPITYANASAGVLLAGVWPALLLAGRRAGHLAVRVPALAAASLLLGTALLAQSKGGVVGLAASTIVIVAVSQARLRLLLAAALALLPVVVAFPVLIAPYRAPDAAELQDVHRAAAALVAVTVAAAVLGAAWVLADARVEIRAERRRLIGRIVGIAFLAVLVLALGVAAVSHPGRRLDAAWRSFSNAPSPLARTGSSTHLVELGSNRYDFWRVALGEFRRRPLVGDGARGFGPAYLVRGRSSETPARAHSLPLELLGEEGIVGFALAAAAFALLLGGLARRARRRSAVATGALGGCVLLLAQAGVDWTFTFPAVTIPFFLLAGIGLADDERRSLGRRPRNVASAATVVAAVVLFAPPWIAAKLVRQGLAARSTGDLTWAHRLDPVSVDPWVAEAQIAPSAAAAVAPLERARARAPRALAVRYLLGSVYWNAGRKADAEREFEAALALHPKDPAVERALAVVRR